MCLCALILPANFLSVCRFVKTTMPFTQQIKRDKSPTAPPPYVWGAKVNFDIPTCVCQVLGYVLI